VTAKRKPVRKPTGPRKSLAAEFLRKLAAEKYLSVDKPAATAADLRLIADCIERKANWRKALKRPPAIREQINLAAYWVEYRDDGVSVEDSLDVCSTWLVHELSSRGLLISTDKARQLIETARKKERKAGWPTLEK
jgi:hypothetical protein